MADEGKTPYLLIHLLPPLRTCGGTTVPTPRIQYLWLTPEGAAEINQRCRDRSVQTSDDLDGDHNFLLLRLTEPDVNEFQAAEEFFDEAYDPAYH